MRVALSTQAIDQRDGASEAQIQLLTFPSNQGRLLARVAIWDSSYQIRLA